MVAGVNEQEAEVYRKAWRGYVRPEISLLSYLLVSFPGDFGF
jgi:hypothetical protein